MVVYVGLEDVVEGGDVVVAELKNSVSSEFHGRPEGHGRPVIRRLAGSGRPVPGRKSGTG